jgi:hypothetical protein
MTSDLDGNMSGRAKPIETEPLARLDFAQAQCAVADDSGTEEGAASASLKTEGIG